MSNIRGKEVRERMLQVIIGYIEEHGYSPTFREIGEMTGLKSTSSVASHMKKLFEEGKLETDTGMDTPRAIRVPGYKFVKVAE